MTGRPMPPSPCAVCGRPAVATRSTSPVCASCDTPEIAREARRVYLASYRANAIAATNTLTLSQWIEKLVAADWTCSYCKRAPAELLDHVKGIAAGNTAKNVRPCCVRCNILKGNSEAFVPVPAKTVQARLDERLLARWNTWKDKHSDGTLDDFAKVLASSYAPVTVCIYASRLEHLGVGSLSTLARLEILGRRSRTVLLQEAPVEERAREPDPDNHRASVPR